MTKPAALTNKQIRYLKEQAHHLVANVRLGDAGLSAGIVKEINKVLSHHELVKIKIPSGDKASKQSMVEEICKATQSTCVQTIGNTATLYKPNPEDPKINLPKS